MSEANKNKQYHPLVPSDPDFQVAQSEKEPFDKFSLEGTWVIQQLAPFGIPMHLLIITVEDGKYKGLYKSQHPDQYVKNLSFDGEYLIYSILGGDPGDEVFTHKWRYHQDDVLAMVHDPQLPHHPLRGVDFDVNPDVDFNDKYHPDNICRRGAVGFGYKLRPGRTPLNHQAQYEAYLAQMEPNRDNG